MSKIIGLICAWGSEWISEAVMKQAFYCCDEVIVAVGATSEAMKKYEDKTLKIFKKYPVKIVPVNFKGIWSTSRAATLNDMLKRSKYFEPGNWIWLLDDDEFYSKKDIDEMKLLVASNKYDSIITNEYFYYLNLNYYLNKKDGRCRLWKIQKKDDRFIPTQKWSSSKKSTIRFGLMHHLSFLMNPYAKIDFWKTEYSKKQDNKVKWMQDVYMRFSIEKQEYWLKYCEKKYGLKNLFHIGKGIASGDKNQHLFKRNFKLPVWIEEFKDVEDFRKRYKL